MCTRVEGSAETHLLCLESKTFSVHRWNLFKIQGQNHCDRDSWLSPALQTPAQQQTQSQFFFLLKKKNSLKASFKCHIGSKESSYFHLLCLFEVHYHHLPAGCISLSYHIPSETVLTPSRVPRPSSVICPKP
jgi:hypothetical protein